MLLFANCTEVEKCETNNTGSVKVVNHSGFNLIVDVTWGSYTYNDERTLYNGNYTTYSNVPAGYVEIWGSFDGINWSVGDLRVNACETSTYTWNYKKSTTEKSTLELIADVENGEIIIRQKSKSKN
jgi:hypothetical protein